MDRTHSFGYWLKRRRKALDLTQAELAQHVSCSLDLIQKIEADVRRPSRQLAERLADSLGLDAAERVAFVQAARAERAVDSLALPSQPAEQPLASLPQGTLTFLLTDIEGSTRLWEQHPRSMPAALARHDTLLKEIVAAHSGVVFKTVGDSVLAAFAQPRNALAAALAVQLAIGSERWELPEPPRVRIALHTGSAETRAGDYFGPTLNRAARLLDAGHGGQVLLSLATEQLVREHLPPDSTLRDLGTHRLKDLSLPEQIFQLVASDLPATFPALNTLGARRTNLPIQPTALIGRERELAQVGALLRQPDVRLLTLTGPGGIGKTRLSLQVAAELVEDFTHGVYFVDLAPIREPALVISAIAQVLEVREFGQQPLLAQLKEFLRSKRMLLVLDNFEQVLDAAPLIAELLAAAGQLKLLITSREALKVRGEKELAVAPLALPDRAALPPLDQLSQYAAVALFIQRALDARPDFEVTNESAPAVAEICVRLDGLPLAIELAAARVKLFAPDALLARLSGRLALLTGGPRDLPARQQTIRNTIAWSYNLLNEAEQRQFAHLGVFVGGWTLHAAEQVLRTGGQGLSESELNSVLSPQHSVLEGLAALLDKSLIRQTDDGNQPRFTMLETIREYALERLEASGEAEALRRRHATYFRDTPQSYTSRRDKIHGLRLESDNLRAALVWSQLAAGDSALALDLAHTLACVEYSRGDYQEAHRLLAQALTYAEGLIDTQRYAEVSVELGQFVSSMGDLAAGRAMAEYSYTLYQKLGDKGGEAYALVNLGWTAREQGDAAAARTLLEQAVVLSREYGDKSLLIYALMTLAEVGVLEENTASAEKLLDECLTLSRESNDPQDIGWTLNHLGHVAQLRGDYDRAAQLHMESLALLLDLLGEKNGGVAEVRQSLGETALGQGDLAAARSWLTAALRLCDELGNDITIAWCLAGLGSAAALDEQAERAARLWGAAERLRAALGCRPAPAARATYERAMTTACSQLGEGALDAAWDAGAALSLDEAIAEALIVEGTG